MQMYKHVHVLKNLQRLPVQLNRVFFFFFFFPHTLNSKLKALWKSEIVITGHKSPTYNLARIQDWNKNFRSVENKQTKKYYYNL